MSEGDQRRTSEGEDLAFPQVQKWGLLTVILDRQFEFWSEEKGDYFESLTTVPVGPVLVRSLHHIDGSQRASSSDLPSFLCQNSLGPSKIIFCRANGFHVCPPTSSLSNGLTSLSADDRLRLLKLTSLAWATGCGHDFTPSPAVHVQMLNEILLRGTAD